MEAVFPLVNTQISQHHEDETCRDSDDVSMFFLTAPHGRDVRVFDDTGYQALPPLTDRPSRLLAHLTPPHLSAHVTLAGRWSLLGLCTRHGHVRTVVGTWCVCRVRRVRWAQACERLGQDVKLQPRCRGTFPGVGDWNRAVMRELLIFKASESFDD